MSRLTNADDLLVFQLVSDPQMSPDGGKILFTKAIVDKKLKTLGHVWTVDVASKETRQWTQGDKGCGGARWSPDGKTIAFVSGRDESGAQIYVIRADGGEATALTSMEEGSIGEIAWSPDGTRIAFLYRPTNADRTKKAEEERKEKGGNTPPWVIDNLWYRLDGDGYFGGNRYGVYVIEVAGGEPKKLFDEDFLGFYSFTWLRDSSGVLVTKHVEPRVFVDPVDEQIFVIKLDGSKTQIPGLGRGARSMLKVSPDGSMVAYLENFHLDDPEYVANERLWVADIKEGKPRCLTSGDDHCYGVANLTDTGAGGGPAVEWTPDGKAIRVMLGWHGTGQLAEVTLDGSVKTLTQGTTMVGVGTLSADGKRQALVAGTPTSLNEVALFENGQMTTLTSFNKPLFDQLDLGTPEEIWLNSPDGTKVQAWCLKPSGFDAGKKYPAVVEVHGGPHCAYCTGYFQEFQVLRAQGYVVVYCNPRGSKGYGEVFCDCIRNDWGVKDWMDVQTLTKWLHDQPFVDNNRIAMMGGSYGGFMTNWAIGHSKDYCVAITDRCVFNWLSMSGNSDFPSWSEGYFKGQFWGSQEQTANLWRLSPIAYFNDVSTPTLVIHSEGDLRCNVEQGEQVFSVLQLKGVPSRFVRYPASTSHGMSRNGPVDMRIHRLNQITDWLGRYLA